MRYLTADDVILIHEAEVGPEPIVDLGLLESAVLRPQTSVGGQDAYPDIHAKAAAMMHSLIRNHPFVDGNKRTAVLCCAVFYRLNGWKLAADQEDIVALALDIAEGQIDVASIAKALSEWSHLVELPDRNEEG